MVLIFYLHCLTSFTGYADDIIHVISNFYIQRSKFGGKTDKPGGNLENSWTPRVHGADFFPNSRDPWHLVAPGRRQVSTGVVVRIVQEKSRAEALLNTATEPENECPIYN